MRLFERDPDHISDCFVFVCEKLCEKNFWRLRSFKVDGAARFPTWLRVVVRNICLDWHRQEFGRHRIFQSIARLPALDQDIFRCIFEQGQTHEESLNLLCPNHPQLTMTELEAGSGRVRGALTDRQLWLAMARRHKTVALEGDPDGDPRKSAPELVDPAPSAESVLVMNEQRGGLEQALRKLSKLERLLIKLRFERGLTLQETASLLGLKDAQTVDRRQREVIEKLRKFMADSTTGRGKT